MGDRVLGDNVHGIAGDLVVVMILIGTKVGVKFSFAEFIALIFGKLSVFTLALEIVRPLEFRGLQVMMYFSTSKGVVAWDLKRAGSEGLSAKSSFF